MISRRAALVVIAMSVPWLVSCERSLAEGGRDITTIRTSTGLPAGTFGPFSEALNGPAINRLRSAYPFFRSAVVPASTYPNQPEALETLSIDVVLLTRKNLDTGLVRRLTTALFEMPPRLSAELDFLHDMEPERAPPTPVPLHHGATLDYRERELRR